MYNFFSYFTSIPPESAFKQFSFEHIIAIIITFSIVTIGLIWLKSLSEFKQKAIIKVCAILVPVVELSHNIWLYRVAGSAPVELLSLHLCGLQMYFIPLAVFTSFIVFKDFIFSTAILGGIFAIVFPSGVAGSYPILHFQTFQTLIYHGLLIFVPMAILITSNYRPSLKRFYKVLLLFLGIVCFDFIIDILFNQNYLFLVTAPDMILLKTFQQNYGPIAYLIFTFLLLLLACIVQYVPFEIYKDDE